MSDADSDSSEEEQVKTYLLVRFVHRGRRRKIESVDIVPSKWVDWKKDKGKFVTKFLPPSTDGTYTEDDIRFIHTAVRSEMDAPESWKEYTIEIEGRADSYKECLKKMEKLQYKSNVLTDHDEMEGEAQNNLERAIKRNKAQCSSVGDTDKLAAGIVVKVNKQSKLEEKKDFNLRSAKTKAKVTQSNNNNANQNCCIQPPKKTSSHCKKSTQPPSRETASKVKVSENEAGLKSSCKKKFEVPKKCQKQDFTKKPAGQVNEQNALSNANECAISTIGNELRNLTKMVYEIKKGVQQTFLPTNPPVVHMKAPPGQRSMSTYCNEQYTPLSTTALNSSSNIYNSFWHSFPNVTSSPPPRNPIVVPNQRYLQIPQQMQLPSLANSSHVLNLQQHSNLPQNFFSQFYPYRYIPISELVKYPPPGYFK